MSKKGFQYAVAVGMMLVVSPIILERLDVVMNDFTSGLMTGGGLGCILLALIKMPRKSTKG
ncbi:hypothetical protein [Paenibacillus sp. GCM10028914]|uniref:hypothetical protein n=1 Tax=Paenibacillus sp. GCM10028914 TaxID=3273416 RepID=UPI0036064997